jgi:AcrR family transcriptional regulator
MEAIADVKSNDQTRQRILIEAERLFAENGFNGVSVRKITTAAGVNLAAVNYHFGNKENLYLDVFRYRWLPRAQKVREKMVKLAENGRPTPDKVIKTLASAFLKTFDKDELRLHIAMMGRELANPGKAFELVSQEALRPLFKLLGKLLGENLYLAQNDLERAFFLTSIFGQILYFNLARYPLSRLTGREFDDEFCDEIAEHITRFSLRGLGLNGQEA